MGRVALYTGFGNPQALQHYPHIAYAGCHFCDYIKQLDQRCFGVLARVKKLRTLGFKKIKLEAFIAEVKADLGL